MPSKSEETLSFQITQQDAIDMCDVQEVYFYVCDGKLPCGRPCCMDHSRTDVCHHTRDESHALYLAHVITSFARYPAVSEDGEAAVICVEPIRG